MSNSKVLRRMACDINSEIVSILSTVELQWLEHWWLAYHSCYELVFETLGKNLIAADLR